ncbi:hypothetical protein [Carnobacterium funditum]|uniref:hypothetical protein n=1 Tax=Carnobacterium funditum TaxID=2752 RepID=UPI000555400D|nr:hypothetical protein [Carnobacterium funditum]
MSIMLGDFISEDNIKLSREEIRNALNEIYSVEIANNIDKVRDSFYRFSELSGEIPSNTQEYKIKEDFKIDTVKIKKEIKNYKGSEEVIKTYSSLNKKVA